MLRSSTDQSEAMTAATPACSSPVGRLMASSAFSIPWIPVSHAERMARRSPPLSIKFSAKMSFKVRSPSLIASPLVRGSSGFAVPWQQKWATAALPNSSSTAPIVALSWRKTLGWENVEMAQSISRLELGKSWRGLSIAKIESAWTRSAMV